MSGPYEDVDTGVTQRIQEDPDLLRLWQKQEHTREQFANMLMEAMGERPPEQRMSLLEKTIRRLRVVIIAVAIPAGSAALLVGKYLIQKGADDERAQLQMQQLVDHEKEVETRLRAIEDRENRDAQQIEDFMHPGRRMFSPVDQNDQTQNKRTP